MREFLRIVEPILASQYGLITSAQIRAEGAHPEHARRLVDRGLWERLDVSLFGPLGVPMTWRRALMAAVLIGPPGTLASHRATAALLGVGGISEPEPEITIPRGSSLRRKGVIVHGQWTSTWRSPASSTASRRPVRGGWRSISVP